MTLNSNVPLAANQIAADLQAMNDNWEALLASVEQLLSTTVVTLAANGEQTVYTVPTGKVCILTRAILVVGADAASTDFTIGADGAETNFLGTQQCDNLDAAGDVGIFMPVPNATAAKGKAYAATTVIKFTVANQAGGATNTLRLFGFLYDA